MPFMVLVGEVMDRRTNESTEKIVTDGLTYRKFFFLSAIIDSLRFT